MTSTTYYQLVRSYRTLAVSRKVVFKRLKTLDNSKVRLVLPAIETGQATTQEALKDARMLSFRQLRDKYASSGAQKAPEPTPQPPQAAATDNCGPAPAIEAVTAPDEPEERCPSPQDDHEDNFTEAEERMWRASEAAFDALKGSDTTHIDAALDDVADAVVDVIVEGSTASVRVTRWGEDDDVRVALGAEVVELDRRAARRLASALLRAIES